ncbi:MAG: hypothetical protein WC716_07975 [Chitinophagaceae bacterium]|jgi:hypothetical protein
MNKKAIGLVSAALIITGGLILHDFYKKDKLKGLDQLLAFLKKKAKKETGISDSSTAASMALK